jgi:hypothetical protein
MKNLVKTAMAAICAIAAANADAQIIPNNSFSQMISNNAARQQILFDQMNAINQVNAARLSAAGTPASAPARPASPDSSALAQPAASPAFRPLQYPMEATDFVSLPMRIMPDQFANAWAGITFRQRLDFRRAYYQSLADYEARGRRNNVSCAVAFAVNVSLRAVYGRVMSQFELEQMAQDYNNALAADPTFRAMTPQQKQALYETMIITGTAVVGMQMQGAQFNNLAMQVQARDLGQAVLNHWFAM